MTGPASSERHSAERDDLANRLLQAVEELAAELHPRQKGTRPVSLDSRLDRDLGLDSLGRVELLARIERLFGVALPEAIFASAETPRDLLRAVQAGVPRSVSARPATVTEVTTAGPVAAPHGAETLIEACDWHVSRHPERLHIRFYNDENEGDGMTYGALFTGAKAVAAGLERAGLEPHQAVAIMLPTGREYFLSFFGALLVGAVPVPLYPPVRPAQLEEHLRRQVAILRNCRATLLITVPQAKAVARLLRAQVETLREVVTGEELLGASGERATAPPPGANDMALLQYTSGSTGTPKGVVLTHANLLANIRADGEAIAASAHDVFVSWLPLYHDMGLIGAWLGSLYYGIPLVIMSPLAFLSRPQRWLWALHRYRGTLSAAPNFAYELCVQRISDDDLKGLELSSWRLAFNGAEAVSPDTVERFAERFQSYGFRPESMYPVYGLAECAVGLSFPPLGRRPLVDRVRREPLMRAGQAIPAASSENNVLRFVACGRPLPRHEIRIVDPTGRELPERCEGRLQFRGPSATGGYYQNPEETRRLFDGDWLESGDRAYFADGDLYITGRSKDIIIRGGRNIYPHEMEERIGDIPGIRKGCVAAFGSVDQQSGTERLVILAETRQADPQRRDALRAEINAVVTDLIGMPADEVILASPHAVLKTSSGKIRRLASRELYERGEIGRRPKAAWWQVTRLALATLVPQLRHARHVLTAQLYSGYAWTVLVLLAIPVWFIVPVLPRVSWRFAVLRRASALLVGALGLSRLLRGLEHLPPPEQPCVLVANHASYLDGAILVGALPRALSFVAKAELAGQFVAGTLLRRMGTEFVERFDRQRGRADAERIARAARAGRTLLFFPEGRLTRIPGLLPFHMGAFLAAAEARLPVIPIAIRGTRSILRPGAWFFRRGKIWITIGERIEPNDQTLQGAEDPWGVALRLRDRAREHILRHCGEPDLSHENPPL